jgi:hypothetical protein
LLALTVFATSTGTADCVGAGGVGIDRVGAGGVGADCVGAGGVGADRVGAGDVGVAAFGAGGTGGIAGRAGVGGGLAAGLDAVTVRGRGAFAGAGTTERTAAICAVTRFGAGSVAGRCRVCVPRADAVGGAGGRSFACGGIVCSTAGSGGAEPGPIKRSSATSKSSSVGGAAAPFESGPSPREVFVSATRDRHYRSSATHDAM